MKKYVLMVVMGAALLGCEKTQQNQPAVEWLPLTGKPIIGTKVYLGTHDYIGRIVQVEASHAFPDGSARDGLRIQSEDGGGFWIPQNTAATMYVTRTSDINSPIAAPSNSSVSQAPIYVVLDAFTVNLMPEKSSDMYMQVSITLNLTKPELEGKIRERMPEIRSHLLALLSGKYASELRGAQGSIKLANEVKAKVESLLGATDVMNVLITSLVIQ